MQEKLKFSRKLAQITALLVLLTCTIVAQQRIEATQAPFNAAAYRVGERLTYDVSFSQFVSAAHVELLVAARGVFFDRDSIQLKAHVETNGVVNVALLSLNNDYTTYVDPETGLPFRAQQVVREAGRLTEASIDYNQPAGTEALPPKLRMGEASVFDLLSALYRVRGLPLYYGANYVIDVRNESVELVADVKVIGKQIIKTKMGSFDAIVARISVKNGTDYDTHVYFSDDEWHVPVLITARPKAGEIRAELAGSALIPQTNPNQRPLIAPAPNLPPQTPVATPTPRPRQPAVSAASSRDDPPPRLDLPFKVGEQLNYQVYAGTGSQAVGSVTLSVKARGRFFNRDGLQLTARAQTNPAGTRIFPVTDQITSYVDPVTLLPFRSELTLSEGKYHTTRNFNLDQDHGTATSDNNRETIQIPIGTHDLLSAIYAIRTFDLTPLRKNAISLMATKQPRSLTATSKRRETLELNGQKIPALLVTLQTDDPQSDRLQLRVWFGDDARHLPLRIMAVTELGEIRADLEIVPVK